MEAAFEGEASSPETLEIQRLIAAYKADRSMALEQEQEQELFAQRKRLADAERIVQTNPKPAKTVPDSLRIAPSKISKARLDLDDLRRTELLDRDSRIFPGAFAPVTVVRDGQRIVLRRLNASVSSHRGVALTEAANL